MPNFSGVWDLRQQGVAQKGGRWQQYIDMTGRAVFGGGFSSDYVDQLMYITIQSAGNSSDFGDLTIARYGTPSTSSATRGVHFGGIGTASNNSQNVIDYVTISSTGNASDFGDMHIGTCNRGSALANATRGVHGGGTYASSSNDKEIDIYYHSFYWQYNRFW